MTGQNNQEQANELQPGDKMEDGSIFAGITPAGRQIFVMPADAGIAMSFNEAARYAEKLSKENTLGHADWRLPEPSELNVLYQNKDKGALKGTFNTTKANKYDDADAYWARTVGYAHDEYLQYFSNGTQDNVILGLFTPDKAAVRCVRLGLYAA